MDSVTTSQKLIAFIQDSPSMFHSVATICKILDQHGFVYLPESADWSNLVKVGGSYYTTRNGSSVIACKIGACALKNLSRKTTLHTAEKSQDTAPFHFQIVASHSDSPTFKLKAQPTLEGPGSYIRLSVEGYGGMINSTWLDRPLGLAGRVLIRTQSGIQSRLYSSHADVALIPNVAIHLNRDANKGFEYNHAVDLCPLFSAGKLEEADVMRMVAKGLGVDVSDIVAHDLYLVNRQRACVWGAASEFVSSPKLDDLQCAFSSVEALISAGNENTISVMSCFDNEEVGSGTKQGALSTLLHDSLLRLVLSLGANEQDYLRALSASFMVSFDNAHAVHPNHPELHDATNQCFLNKGIAIKECASQSYTTDAFSRAVFVTLCEKAGVPVQLFANRSDRSGGSTLGNLSNIQVSMHAVDVGLPQLAMHSSYETAGSTDTNYAIVALKKFYNTNVIIDGASSVKLC
ncbi:M18 family aminopeptidase [Atopobium fossor]|uniref:M18 family aminopeptidase n=1 Tax=Atopobium fossor TaxID=39487 RepID=UPI000483917A|nr:M18 family aminopeptidase [Atopobium fossor]